MRRVTAGASQRFVAATDELENGTPVVSVMGEVDRATAQALEQTLLEVADDQGGRADRRPVGLQLSRYVRATGPARREGAVPADRCSSWRIRT